jgi:hypothetical protein
MCGDQCPQARAPGQSFSLRRSVSSLSRAELLPSPKAMLPSGVTTQIPSMLRFVIFVPAIERLVQCAACTAEILITSSPKALFLNEIPTLRDFFVQLFHKIRSQVRFQLELLIPSQKLEASY